MSRVSSKTTLSPTSGGGIDLGKGEGPDLGKKTQPSASSSGIGITQEVGQVGGMSVTGGISVDVSPVGIDISADPGKGTASIGVSAEIPGGLLGLGGGVEINTSTGEITGGSVRGEVGGFGVEVSRSGDEIGVTISYQIPFTPISISLGFGPAPKSTPTPTPTPTPISTNIPALGMAGCWCTGNVVINYYKEDGTISQTSNSQHWYNSRGGTISENAYWNNDQEEEQAYYSYYTLPLKEEYYTTYLNYYWLTEYIDNAPNKRAPLPQTFEEKWGNGTSLERGITGYLIIRPAPQRLVYDGIDWRFWRTTSTPVEDMRRHEVFNQHIQVFKKTIEVSAWTPIKDLWVALQAKPWNLSSERICWVTISCPDGRKPPTIPPPSNNIDLFSPNPPPTKQMDECCQLSIRLLRLLYKGMGIAKFPGQMPTTIIQKVPKKGEQPAEPPQEPVADWVDLFMWNFKRDDERWGQWEIQIDVKDADLTKEGDQEKSIKFPNLAESVAEMEGQLLSLLTNVEALVAIQTKCLAESGMARQEAIKGYLASKAIIKYMAFKSTEIDVAVPMTFTAGAESISDLIQESEGHIKGTDYTEKETLRDILLDLLQAAAVIRAVHWQKIDSKTDTKSQLLNLLKGSVDLAASIANPKNPNGDGEGENKFDPAQNFEDFLDSAEDGFRNATGITDIQNPYGKTPDRRPRIRQIGDNISQAGGK